MIRVHDGPLADGQEPPHRQQYRRQTPLLCRKLESKFKSLLQPHLKDPTFSQMSSLDSSAFMSTRPRGFCSHSFFFLLNGPALFQAVVTKVHTLTNWSLLPLFYSVTSPSLIYISCPSFPALSWEQMPFTFPAFSTPSPWVTCSAHGYLYHQNTGDSYVYPSPPSHSVAKSWRG